MNRKSFLKGLLALPAVFVGGVAISTKADPISSDHDTMTRSVSRLKLSHHYPGSYHEPHDLFTPEEIEEEGFVFVPFPTCIHRFDDPQNPIMKSYCDGHDLNLRPIVMRTKMVTPRYTKTYDLDAGRVRGIESVADYLRKKDIFKPMILKFMRENEYHYVYRVLMGDSPYCWDGKFGSSDMTYHLYPVFVRGSKLPKRI